MTVSLFSQFPSIRDRREDIARESAQMASQDEESRAAQKAHS